MREPAEDPNLDELAAWIRSSGKDRTNIHSPDSLLRPPWRLTWHQACRALEALEARGDLERIEGRLAWRPRKASAAELQPPQEQPVGFLARLARLKQKREQTSPERRLWQHHLDELGDGPAAGPPLGYCRTCSEPIVPAAYCPLCGAYTDSEHQEPAGSVTLTLATAEARALRRFLDFGPLRPPAIATREDAETLRAILDRLQAQLDKPPAEDLLQYLHRVTGGRFLAEDAPRPETHEAIPDPYNPDDPRQADIDRHLDRLPKETP